MAKERDNSKMELREPDDNEGYKANAERSLKVSIVKAKYLLAHPEPPETTKKGPKIGIISSKKTPILMIFIKKYRLWRYSKG